MCRLAGIYHPDSLNLKDTIVRMRDSMQHGGPDDAGIFLHDKWPLALGHRRLSLIDLTSAGHQPMTFPERGLTIVFNGEIYNYQEIRNTLTHLGYQFHTSTDTEVILKAYDRWGIDCFDFFNGMFALAIWDEMKQELVLARDHAGIKPMYYYISGETLVFASEIRAFQHSDIHFKEHPKWKASFLAFGHLPEPITTLDGVVPLEKGTALVFSVPSLSSKKYTLFKWKFSSDLIEEEEAIFLIRETIQKSVERHMISDAPLGLFLSGGIDSSILTIIASNAAKSLQTLSIVFKEQKFSEEKFQKIIVEQTKSSHTSYLVTKKEFDDNLFDSLLAMDLPSLDGINTYFISKYARAHGLKAVLSGLGADELFGGYPSFYNQSKINLLNFLPDKLLLTFQHLPDYRLRKISYIGIHNTAAEYLTHRGIFTPLSIAEILDTTQDEVVQTITDISKSYYPGSLKNGNRMSWMETSYYMQNQLLKDADYMSMWHGLELRVPFLDKELMMLVSQVNPTLKYNRKTPKYLLVKSFMNELPEQIWNRKKQGFTFPFDGWLKENQFSKPTNLQETILYEKFNKGTISWSRYWCGLLMNRFNDKLKYAA
jgi:asparagine synthase (glutamine-hydrolysing)